MVRYGGSNIISSMDIYPLEEDRKTNELQPQTKVGLHHNPAVSDSFLKQCYCIFPPPLPSTCIVFFACTNNADTLNGNCDNTYSHAEHAHIIMCMSNFCFGDSLWVFMFLLFFFFDCLRKPFSNPSVLVLVCLCKLQITSPHLFICKLPLQQILYYDIIKR